MKRFRLGSNWSETFVFRSRKTYLPILRGSLMVGTRKNSGGGLDFDLPAFTHNSKHSHASQR